MNTYICPNFIILGIKVGQQLFYDKSTDYYYLNRVLTYLLRLSS